MIDTAHGDNHRSDNVDETGEQTYGEQYFKHYHTGLGAIAYERSHHWLGFFATIADEIIRVFRPDSVLDAGCALGILVESLWDRGVKAQGIDVSRYAIENVRPDLRSHCRVASLTDRIEGAFDLVTCIEVLEHLQSADAEAAIANICSVTDTVLFSSTPSDFDEPTHVNVCPPIVWIELFAAQGFGPDILADATFLTSHAMIFRRGNPCESTFLKAYAMIVRYRMLSSERLEAIAVERNNAHVARLARNHAEEQLVVYAERYAETIALVETIRAELQTALAVQHRAEAQLVLEEQRHAEAIEARADADARAQLLALERAHFMSEVARFETQLQGAQRLNQEMLNSSSWRITRPLRLVAISLRRLAYRLKH